MIKQNQLLISHQNILGTEVAMDQRVRTTQCPFHSSFRNGAACWTTVGAVLIVRFKPQRSEELFIGEDRRQFVTELEAFAMN